MRFEVLNPGCWNGATVRHRRTCWEQGKCFIPLLRVNPSPSQQVPGHPPPSPAMQQRRNKEEQNPPRRRFGPGLFSTVVVLAPSWASGWKLDVVLKQARLLAT